MSTTSFRIACKSILEEGSKLLGLDMGIVSRIIDHDYEIREVVSKLGVFVAGETFKLEDTYCREVVSKGKTLALTEIDNVPGLQKHPLYVPLALEAYISSPIFFDNKVWGTINFSSMRIRKTPFNKHEIEQVESMANKVAELISEHL